MHIQAKLGQENILRLVRWVRCPPDTGFEIQTLEVWGRARYLSVTEAPRNTEFYERMGKKHFCFFQTVETGKRTPNSTVKGSNANHHPRAPPPFRVRVWRIVTSWVFSCRYWERAKLLSNVGLMLAQCLRLERRNLSAASLSAALSEFNNWIHHIHYHFIRRRISTAKWRTHISTTCQS